MRTLEIIKEFDKMTYENPSRLLVDGVKTGVRWNGDTKRDLYGKQNPDDSDNFAFTLVQELDFELESKLTHNEKIQFYSQLKNHLNDYPE